MTEKTDAKIIKFPGRGLEEDDASESTNPVLLVVDDDQDILRVVKFYLTKQNYTVHAASGGNEALAILKENPRIELILSDVMMPEMTGLELLKIIRDNKEYSEIPVILISAEGETSKKVAGLNLGADDFITKPFNFDELMARVKNHIRLRRLQKEVLIANKQVMHVNNMLKSQNEKLIEDLEQARGVQMALLPDVLPESEKFQMGSRYLPAERLGGDFFDIVDLADGKKLGVMVADVCGHGVSAAFTTAMTKITFRNSCFNSDDPAEVIYQMNEELFGNIKSGFVTVFYGVLDLEQETFHYASGGHPPLLLHRYKDDSIEELKAQSTFLGSFNGLEFTSDVTHVSKGDRILFYTDGIFESQNMEGEQFGLERVNALLRSHKNEPMQTLLDTLINTLVDFIDGMEFDDDITVVGIDIKL